MTDKTVSVADDPAKVEPVAPEAGATMADVPAEAPGESRTDVRTAVSRGGASDGGAATAVSTRAWLKKSSGTWWGRYTVRILSVLVLIGLWHLASTYDFRLLLNFENVPAPGVVGGVLLELLSSDTFYRHIAASVERVAIAFGLATVSGVALGVFMGRIRLVEDVFSPYVEIFRPIPAVAWIPLAILMLPTEQSSIIFITFLGAFFPIVLNTMHGVDQTPKDLVRAARALGASSTSILIHVVLPAALPSIVAGMAIGMGIAWFSLLAGEIISGQYGIGYFTWSSYSLIQYPQIIVGMVTIGLLGTLSTLLVRYGTRPFLRWQR
nr:MULTISPECIES: ABC transporter permease [unclassified Thioalkalivibrio]